MCFFVIIDFVLTRTLRVMKKTAAATKATTSATVQDAPIAVVFNWDADPA